MTTPHDQLADKLERELIAAFEQGFGAGAILHDTLQARDAAIGYASVRIDALKPTILRLASRAEKMEQALAKSVALQSHYAGLLNNYDGGQRLTFANAQAWLNRLSALKDKN